MKLLKSLFSRKEDVHIEIFPSESGDERISLIPIKTVTIEHDDRNRKYKVGGELYIPAFSTFRNYSCRYKNGLDGFSEAYVVSNPSIKVIIDNDFLDKYCVEKYSTIKFKDGYECYMADYVIMDSYCNHIFTQIKLVFSAIFLTFEEEAVNAFKAGMIDVFLNMVKQLDICKTKEEQKKILDEVYDYFTKLFNTLVEMDAQKEILIKSASLALGLKEEADEAKKEARLNSQNSFLQEISARKELLECFNTPI